MCIVNAVALCVEQDWKLFNVFTFRVSQIEEVLLYSLGVAYYSYPEDPNAHGISGHVCNVL